MIFETEKKAKMSKLCSKLSVMAPSASVQFFPLQHTLSSSEEISPNTGRVQWAAGGSSGCRNDPTHASPSHLPLELLCELPGSWEGWLPSSPWASQTVWSPPKPTLLKGDTIFPPCPHSWLALGAAILEKVILTFWESLSSEFVRFNSFVSTDYLLLFFACYSCTCY